MHVLLAQLDPLHVAMEAERKKGWYRMNLCDSIIVSMLNANVNQTQQ